MENQFKLKSEEHKVLFVGLVCLDIINVIEEFPTEDQGHRCSDCMWRGGGNACNSACVLSLLGGNAHFFGTLAEAPELEFLKSNFNKFNVHFDRSIFIQGSSSPTSVVILSKKSGSRTVLHTNKKLRELTLTDLQTTYNLSGDKFGWIHFEGRDNACEIAKMLRYLNDYNKQQGSHKIVLSLEAEKLRLASGLIKYNMWELPDVMFVSKDFAQAEGYSNMNEAAQGFYSRLKPGAVLICPWGELGAAAMSEATGLVTTNAFPPAEIVDTCGAGDTFIGATIYSLSTGKNLKDSIVFGCKIAGAKCGIQGFVGLSNY